MMKILIADDHALFRGGLRQQLIERNRDDLIIEASDFPSLLAVADHECPDIIVVDLGMAGLPWREALERLRARMQGARIVVLSASDDEATVHGAMRMGIDGFISKQETPEVVMAALDLVCSGGTCVPPSFARRGRMAEPPSQKIVTQRQQEVLLLLAQGLANKEIAYRLSLTEGTVKLHVAAILKAVGAANRTQAVAMARSSGLLENGS